MYISDFIFFYIPPFFINILMYNEREKLDELISDLLSVIYEKGLEARKYAENAERFGRYQDKLIWGLRNFGLNGHDAGIFLSRIGALILPSINAVCKRKKIEEARPYLTALYFNKRDIIKSINKGIDNMAIGHREYLEGMADRADYFRHIYHLES